MTRKIVTLTVVLLTSLSGMKGQDVSETYMIRPHEKLPTSIDSTAFTTIFLAGTIDMGNSIDWQSALYREFSEKDGRYILYNPRQSDWDASRPGEMEYQVNWELSRLEESDYIIMYILEDSKSPISLLEMGLHARSGKMFVICGERFYRYDNVWITCEYYGIPLFKTLDEFKNSDQYPFK